MGRSITRHVPGGGGDSKAWRHAGASAPYQHAAWRTGDSRGAAGLKSSVPVRSRRARAIIVPCAVFPTYSGAPPSTGSVAQAAGTTPPTKQACRG